MRSGDVLADRYRLEDTAALVADGLFAWNFNRESVIIEAGRPTYEFVMDVVRRTGREP